jgi:sortase B
VVTSNEVKKSAKSLVRRIILGIAIIGVIGSAAWLINDKIIQPYKYLKSQQDTSITDESNTQTTQLSSNDTTENVQAKYSALLDVNPDFVGKLYIPAIDETGFNVVQTNDNSKYLTTGFKGETTRYGTLFVDYRNNVKDFNYNTIIYGHNMRDGTQLGSLSLYNKVENYKKYPTIEFNTIYGNYTWKIFAAFITNSESSQDNGYNFPYLTTTFKSEAKFLEFIDEVKQRSYYTNSSVDINANDKIITLSTCDTVFDGARFVLMARLVRTGESTDVDTSTVEVNSSQRYPQAWYDAKGKTNPYKNAEKFSLN